MKKLKTKTKLLKQKEIEEENRTYEEILQEVRELNEGTAAEYVPRLCTALKRKNPLISSAAIRATVIRDLCPSPWKEGTVRQYWPNWMVNQEASQRATASNILRAEGKTKTVFVSPQDQERDEENEPVSSMSMDEYEETHPKTELSPFQIKGDINRAIHTLFGRLTGVNHMPHMEDDVKKQYVIETRERAKDIINGISKIERDFLYNWLTWLGMVMDDWTNLLEKADKTAYDTRE